jgi:hypothetical protein
MIHHDLLDETRSACLGDVGAPEYIAATVVSGDGTETYLLALADAINDGQTLYDRHCLDAGHEQDGPLPIDVWLRIWAEPSR